MGTIKEDSKNKRISGGVFSVLDNQWIQQPVAKNIPEIDQDAFDEEFSKWETKYLDLMQKVSIEGIEDFVDSIYAYRQEGLNNGGEFSIQNLVFKELRNLGYLDTLKQIKTELTQKELSLESITEDLQAVDSEGNPLTQDQVNFFRDSKIRNDQGNLLVVYHGTNASFSVFEKGDIGYHFGTNKQAQEIIDRRGGGHIDQYYLNIKKYLYFSGDPGTWGGVYLFDEFMNLVDDDLIDLPSDVLEKLINCVDLNNFGNLFKNTLIENGYDGIVYRNTFEAHDENGELDLENAEDSFIAFYPNQIKAITNKTPSLSDNINEEINEVSTFVLNNKEKQYYIDSQEDEDVINDLTRTMHRRWYLTTDPDYDIYGELNEDGFDYILVIGNSSYDALTKKFVNDMFINCGTYDELLGNMEDDGEYIYCSLDNSNKKLLYKLDEKINKQNSSVLFNKLGAKLNDNYFIFSSSVDGRPILDVEKYDIAVDEIEKGIAVGGMWTDSSTGESYPQPNSYILSMDINKAKQIAKDLCQMEFIEFHFVKEDEVVSQVYATTDANTYDDYAPSGKPSRKVVIGDDANTLDYYSIINGLKFSFGVYGCEDLDIFKKLTENKEK